MANILDRLSRHQCVIGGLALAMIVAGWLPAAVRAGEPEAKDSVAPPTTLPIPATQPSSQPSDLKVGQLLDYLEAEYSRKSTSNYWVSRAVGAISLARSPRPSATLKLFDLLEKDKQEVVRLLAWQAILARAADIDGKQFARFCQGTWTMADQDLFHGGLRVPLVRLMALVPPTDRTRRIWQKLFSETNAWEPQDVPVIDALGDCLRSWKSPILATGLINLLTNKDHSCRAEYVLHRAGCTARTAKEMLPPEVFDTFSTKRVHPGSKDLWRSVRDGCEKWFVNERASWKEPTAMDGEPWRTLSPLYVAPPIALDKIDPNDPLWRQDLELNQANLAQFEVVFVVDATASMGDVLDWLKHDVASMATAFQMLCKEPVAIGITFYRDFDCTWVVEHHALTTRLKDLEPGIKAISAEGGGDIPEAVLEGLQDAILKNRWSKRSNGCTKVMILLGDAPPHPPTISACVDLARQAAAAGMRIHAAKITTDEGKNDLSAFDQIAKAGGGSTVDVTFHRLLPIRFVDAKGKEIPFKPQARPEVQLVVAPPPPGELPGEKILTHVLEDTISPQYRNRVEPLARTLLAYCQGKSEPEQREAFFQNTPGMMKADAKSSQGK